MPRHVDEDDAVVGREAREVGRAAPPGRSCRPSCRCALERLHELGGDRVVAGEDQRPGSPLTIVFESARSFWLNVSRAGLDDGAERVEAGLGRRDVERDPVDAGLEVDRLRCSTSVAVREQADGRRLGDRRADLGDRLDRLAEAGGRRARQPLHEDLVRVAEADQVRLDLGCRGSRRGRPRSGRRRSCRCRRTAGRSASGRRRGRAPWRAAARPRCPSRTGPVSTRSGRSRASSDGSRSTSASLPNATMPGDVARRASPRASRAGTRARPRGPSLPTESDRSTTKTVASRSTGRTSWNPARASTRATSRTLRTMSAARRRPAPSGGATPRCSADVSTSAGTSRSSASGVSNVMPIRPPRRVAGRSRAPAPRRSGPASRW